MHRPPRHADKRRGRSQLWLLVGFAGVVTLFAWHNSAYLSAWGTSQAAGMARQRLGLEGSGSSATLASRWWASSSQEGDHQAGDAAAGAPAATPAAAAGAHQQQQQPKPASTGLLDAGSLKAPSSGSSGSSGSSSSSSGSSGGPSPVDTRPPVPQVSTQPAADSKVPAAGASGATKAPQAAAPGAAATPSGAVGSLGGKPAAAPEAAGSSGSKQTTQQQQQQQQRRPPQPGASQAQPAPGQKGSGSNGSTPAGKAAPAKKPGTPPQPAPAPVAAPVGHIPPQPFAPVSKPTLVLYVFLGTDPEHLERMKYFIRAGVREGDGATYKLILARPGISKAGLPKLPPNAEYLTVPGSGCSSTWGAIGGVMPQLQLEKFEFVVSVDSTVMGPFLPPYIAPLLHWTEVLTQRLSNDTRMAGPFVSCEGAPKAGDVRAEWRLNPYIMPHTWATDKAGLFLLAQDPAILKCYDGDAAEGGGYWGSRYYGDAGAGLAMLRAGYNLGSLLLRYQGVDWRNKENWGCNERLRPDIVGVNDGIAASPYEVLFLPLSIAEAPHRLMLRIAAHYAEWAAPESGQLNLTRNEFRSEEWADWGDWATRGRKVLEVSPRWSCFDQDYYLEQNPDLARLPQSGEEAVGLFDHFLMLGQFQGRPHRFVCGEPRLSREDALRLAIQRGRACFDHEAYKAGWSDLGSLTTPKELWLHYVEHGQFEGRRARFVCPETMSGLEVGLDGTSVSALDEEAAILFKALSEGSDPSTTTSSSSRSSR